MPQKDKEIEMKVGDSRQDFLQIIRDEEGDESG